MNRSISPGRCLAKLAAAGLVLMGLGGLLVWLVTPMGWLLAVVGALLFFVGPLVVAWTAAGSAARPDHRVEGRTYVIDVFRSVKAPRSAATDRHRPPSDPMP
jgi:hypothetical protein